ncbi:MAG: 3-phosphoglycerate dehydrogenase [Tannerella sp.]|jgi:D-3-phosphoglycerate dehydrogenase|nr:3-phosphoglycerate dehydrogenase [Tannerella sp.]
MKILLATEKPFAAPAANAIREVIESAGMTMASLEKYTHKTQLLDAVADADALIIRSDVIDREVFDAARQLKIVVRAGAGYDNVDLVSATAHHVCVMNTPGQNANAVAELALGLMVYGVRNFFNGTSGTELKDKKLGIHAYGNVGRHVARIARGFGMEVCAFDPFLSAETIEKDGIRAAASVRELYETCPFVSLHIPATPETKNAVGYDLLSAMPEGAMLVNTARREVVHEAGLLKVMEERPDFRYMTDIAPAIHAELTERFAARYFGTPKKTGAQTAEANNNAGIAAATQIVDFLLNGNEKFRINPS